MNAVEHYFDCPYCWQRISMVLDLSAAQQCYIEDCERCCNPVEIRFTVEDGVVIEFAAEGAK